MCRAACMQNVVEILTPVIRTGLQTMQIVQSVPGVGTVMSIDMLRSCSFILLVATGEWSLKAAPIEPLKIE